MNLPKEDNLDRPINGPICPKCGKLLTIVRYIEYGAKSWTGDEWRELDSGDSEWRADCCDAELDYDDLLKLRIF